jgi:hypothetical protein
VEVGGSGEFVTVATAKVEIWRGPDVLRFFYPMINGSIAKLFFLLLPLKGNHCKYQI